MVMRMAWPAIVENALHTLLGIVDTILVARLGTEAVAGVGAGVQWIFLFFSILFGLSTGAVVLVARAIGARDRAPPAGRPVRPSCSAPRSGSPSRLLCLLFAEPALRVLGAAPEVAAIGTSFLRIASYSGVLMAVGVIAGAVLRAAGDTRTPMLSTAVANVVNAARRLLAHLRRARRAGARRRRVGLGPGRGSAGRRRVAGLGARARPGPADRGRRLAARPRRAAADRAVRARRACSSRSC